MAKNFGLKVEGIDAAVSALRLVGDALAPQRIQECLLVGAQLIQARARELAPSGSGVNRKGEAHTHLKDAIFASKGRLDPAAPSVLAGVSVKRAPHAHLVEYGHVLWRGGVRSQGRGHQVGSVPAHPFLRPALDKSVNDIPALVTDMIRRTLEAFGINPS